MPVFNEERFIEDSIAAMRGQRFPGQLEFLVVDGGSTDRTPEIVKALAREDDRIRLLFNPRRTAASGLNVALGHARGRWVARMDAHTEYPEDYLALGVERLQRGGTRWVSGLAVASGRGPVSRAVALALRSPLGRGGSRKWIGDPGSDSEWELDSGVFAGVWERQTVLDYGGWDERWDRNQDSEMAGRFLAKGERLILIPAMGASYVPRDSLSSLARQYLHYGEFRTRTAVRHPHTMRRSHLLAPAVVATLPFAVIPGPLRGLARLGLGTYLAAVITAAAKSAGEADSISDAALVAPVLVAMHFGHGLGALRESLTREAPVAAIAGVLGLDGLVRSTSPADQPVFAPSLTEALRGGDLTSGADD